MPAASFQSWGDGAGAQGISSAAIKAPPKHRAPHISMFDGFQHHLLGTDVQRCREP